jgi:predicted dienelactone hydrolase
MQNVRHKRPNRWTCSLVVCRTADGGGSPPAVGSANDSTPCGFALLPVLVFSTGYPSLASAYTALFEDLARHSYVVL